MSLNPSEAMPAYSVVIATHERERELQQVLGDWSGQTKAPEKIVVCRPDDSPRRRSEDIAAAKACHALTEISSGGKSAARQRNLGAREVATEWIVFCDDDVRFGPDLAATTTAFLANHAEAVAVFPRMCGAGHPRPGRLLQSYYALQAGYRDETFGACLFGPGISCYPCWERQVAPVEANWLPSTMLWIRTEVFRRHQFPDFEGYSFGEDAHLTHRVWREAAPSGGKMYFLGSPAFEHHSIQSGVKARRFELGRMTVKNQERIAREAMGKSRTEVLWKSWLHRGFLTLALARQRRAGWLQELAGIWAA